MTYVTRILSGVAVVALSVGLAAGSAVAQSQHVEQDPNVGGQLNGCWGQTASQTAKLETPEGTNGGGMGQHSRSTKAANKNGGFASDGNGFGIKFNVKGPDGNAGRQGVGNVSADANGPHQVHPGDGGNGQHAINNGTDTDNGVGFATILNPVTGQFVVQGVNDVTLECDLVP